MFLADCHSFLSFNTFNPGEFYHYPIGNVFNIFWLVMVSLMRKSTAVRSVTILDVAREAGVSPTTVSRVLNGHQHVRQDKQTRVLNAVTRLGYVVNQQARSLAGGRSGVIGLVLHDLGTGYAGEVMRGIEMALASHQYDLMLHTTHGHSVKESVYVNMLTRGLTDGLLLLLPLNPGAYLKSLRHARFPYVVIDDQGVDDRSPTVVAKNFLAAREAICFLIGLGHQRIGFLEGRPGLSSAVDRFEGYKAALQEHHIPFDPDLVRPGNFVQLDGYHGTLELLDLPEPPTAIFGGSDLAAMGAIDAVRSRGLVIPDDVSVMGFDDIPQAASIRPALTTVRQPLVEMGQYATEMLFERINNPDLPITRIELDTELVIRDSCAPRKMKGGNSEGA